MRARPGVQGIRWQGSFRHDGARFSETFATRRAAETWLARQQAASAEGRLNLPSSLTVGQLLDHWLEVRGPKLRSPQTRQTYASAVKMLGPLHKRKVEALRPDHVDRFVNDLLAGGSSPSTAVLLRFVLGNAFKYGVRWRLVRSNPVADSEPIEADPAERPHVTLDQARKLLAASAHDRLAPLWVVALTCGLRNGELRGLRHEDIDRERDLLHVRRSRWKDGSSDGPTKTRRAHPVPLPPELRALPPGEGLLFTNEDGSPLKDAQLRRRFRALLAEAGLPDMTPHACRHGVASLGPGLGIHPLVQQELLGHARLQQTIDYTHVGGPEQREAARRIRAALGLEVGRNDSSSE